MAQNTITLVMPYYNNPNMLRRHIQEWNSYSDDLKEKFKVILVDDGSQVSPAKANLIPSEVSLQLYRIKEDIPWNQHGARNLGMTFSEGWCLITDIDHLLTEKNLKNILKYPLNKLCAYKPKRTLPDNSYYKSHPNSYVIHRDLFWQTGGCDEAYAGYYGIDSTFRRRLTNYADIIEFDDIYLILYRRDTIADASTTTYGRKGSEYAVCNNHELARRKKENPQPIPPLNFTWERIL